MTNGRDTGKDEVKTEGEHLSLLSRHSGQRTIQRGLRKSRCGESARRYRTAAEDLSAECGEGSVARSRLDDLLRFPSTTSRSGVWKKAGVSTI